MSDIVIRELDAEALYRRCDHAQFDFETTAELEELEEEVVGQPRAVAAVQFGLGIWREGYNVFALGPEGIGKYSLARRFAEKEASGRPVPPDPDPAPGDPSGIPGADRLRRLRDRPEGPLPGHSVEAE